MCLSSLNNDMFREMLFEWDGVDRRWGLNLLGMFEIPSGPDPIGTIYEGFSTWARETSGVALLRYNYEERGEAIPAILTDLSKSKEFLEIINITSIPLARAVMEQLFLVGLPQEPLNKPYDHAFWVIMVGLIFFDTKGGMNPFLEGMSSLGKDPIFKIISQGGYHVCVDWIFARMAEYQKTPLHFNEVELAWLTIAKGWEEGQERPPAEFYRVVNRQSPEERNKMYEAAYFYYEYPFLHEPLSEDQERTMGPYSINMIWLHSIPQGEEVEYLYSQFEAEMGTRAVEWATLNPGTRVNLWYDGRCTPQDAVRRSARKINETFSQHKILFIDMRQLYNHPEFENLFSLDKRKIKGVVYVQVDALKVLIANFLGKKGEIAICADIDCMALAKTEIFCKRTLAQLRHSGIVLAAFEGNSYENNFIITSPEHSAISMGVFKETLKILAIREETDEEVPRDGVFYVEYYDLLAKKITLPPFPPGCSRQLPTKPVPVPLSQFA